MSVIVGHTEFTDIPFPSPLFPDSFLSLQDRLGHGRVTNGYYAVDTV